MAPPVDFSYSFFSLDISVSGQREAHAALLGWFHLRLDPPVVEQLLFKEEKADCSLAL